MPILHTFDEYNNSFPESVLARGEGLRAPNHVEIDSNLYGSVSNFPPGLFAGTTGTSKYRFLPRTKWVSLDANTATVSRWTACVFVPGDVLTVIDTSDGSAGAAVGTVLSVDVTGDCNKITFTAAPVAPSVGDVIGIATSRPVKSGGDRLGLVCPNSPINFNRAPDTNFGCFSGAVVHRSLLPHIDDELEKLFPMIDFVTP